MPEFLPGSRYCIKNHKRGVKVWVTSVLIVCESAIKSMPKIFAPIIIPSAW